jgi:predicted metal-dependent peptidase
MKDKQEVRVKKAHITLMQHPKTCLYSGVIASGKNDVVDGEFTAYTDGMNKRYSKQFLQTIKTESQLRGLILHENLHVALKHIPRNKDIFNENQQMANFAADFVVNDVIVNTGGQVTLGSSSEPLVDLPDGALYDEFFHDWSVRKVYDYLKKNAKPKPPKGKGGFPCPNPQGKGDKGDEDGGGGDSDSCEGEMEIELPSGKKLTLKPMDEHDVKGIDGLTPDEVKELSDNIDKKLRQGGILAGRMGANVPRAIGDMLEPKVDWREVLREFVMAQMRGKDEMTWRRMNKRQMVNDIYMPSVISETMGEVVVAIDTSGSIDNKQISEFASELASICEVCNPEKVRVLWWDTAVHGEQVFETGDYSNIGKMLKPMGGGGTYVSCVNEYLVKHDHNPECVLVFTDGYVESDIKWTITAPSIWFVTMCKNFEPPLGNKAVYVEEN